MLGYGDQLMNGFVDQIRSVVPDPVFTQEGRRHVEAIQPHLVGIDFLVPEASVAGPGMGVKLFEQGVHGHPETGVPGRVRQVNEYLAGVDEIQVVVAAFVQVYGAIVGNDAVAPLVHIVEVPHVSRRFPEFHEGHAAHALCVTEIKAFAVVKLVELGKACHLRLGHAGGQRYITALGCQQAHQGKP